MYHAIGARIMRKGFEALSVGDYSLALRGSAPNVHHIFAGKHAIGGERHSREAFRFWFERVFRLFPSIKFQVHEVLVNPRWSNAVVWLLGLGFCLAYPADVRTEELRELPICSAATVAAGTAPEGVCTVEPLDNGHNKVKINLTAQTAPIEVAGYTVTTDNYNGKYLTPVVEAMPGDTVAAHLANVLECRGSDGQVKDCPKDDGMDHGGDHDMNPTNLHYFHGGIVTPNNARPDRAECGDGDNVYVYLRSDKDAQGQQKHCDAQEQPHSFDLRVPIPGEGQLDARVLEEEGYISHPLGLNWYHSHLHGISSHQVMGGMSGLLSTGDATANVRAACRKDPNSDSECPNDVAKETDELKKRTKVRYVLLRDISLKDISKRPEESGDGTATWAPMMRDFPEGSLCGVWDGSKLNNDPEHRLGFCQSKVNTDENKDELITWLFTLNGQRYPTITVKEGENLLVRMGNVSSNIGYLLELKDNGETIPLTVLSLDGVVPGRPVLPDQADKPVEALELPDFLLMPASRVEFYVRNDQGNPNERRYVLRTKGLRGIGNDAWPEIQLAEIVLEPSDIKKSDVKVGLNANVATPVPILTRAGRFLSLATNAVLPEEDMPLGCVRDLKPEFNEYRRVTFFPDGETTSGHQTKWSIKTEIVRPSGPTQPDSKHKPDDPAATTIGPIPFEEYVLGDGTIDWTNERDLPHGRHVCIKLDGASHEGSHKQLWVLRNATDTLHNFHIHQMKFRLATRQELEKYHIDPSQPERCAPESLYKCFDDLSMQPGDPQTVPIFWHDTIPVPPLSRVFVVMSYDAKEQIGRFVFHCHILKHEDEGLMAPIEVWGEP